MGKVQRLKGNPPLHAFGGRAPIAPSKQILPPKPNPADWRDHVSIGELLESLGHLRQEQIRIAHAIRRIEEALTATNANVDRMASDLEDVVNAM